MTYYILKDHEAVPTTDLKAVEACLKDVETRRVAVTEGEGWRVSTVCVCLDYGAGGPFETMVFRTDESVERLDRRVPEWQERYATWEEAAAGHDAMVRQVNEWLAGR